MEFKCSVCNRNFNSEESLSQHNQSKHSAEGKNKIKGKRNLRKYLIIGILILIVVLTTLTINSYNKKPGSYDDFAKCLTDKGAVVYGNDYCAYTNQQLNFFGKSKKYLNYIKCADNEKLCNEKNVRITPTWEINGEIYDGVQDFQKLSALSGCEV